MYIFMKNLKNIKFYTFLFLQFFKVKHLKLKCKLNIKVAVYKEYF